MITKEILINIPNDLDARPIALLVQVASQYESDIHVISTDKKINAKSIMGMMSLGINSGEKITVMVEGPDEEDAIKKYEEENQKQLELDKL